MGFIIICVILIICVVINFYKNNMRLSCFNFYPKMALKEYVKSAKFGDLFFERVAKCMYPSRELFGEEFTHVGLVIIINGKKYIANYQINKICQIGNISTEKSLKIHDLYGYLMYAFLKHKSRVCIRAIDRDLSDSQKSAINDYFAYGYDNTEHIAKRFHLIARDYILHCININLHDKLKAKRTRLLCTDFTAAALELGGICSVSDRKVIYPSDFQKEDMQYIGEARYGQMMEIQYDEEDKEKYEKAKTAILHDRIGMKKNKLEFIKID